MSTVLSPQEIKDDRTGKTISIVLHAIAFLLLFMSFMEFQVPPPGQSGVLVSFGEPEQGRNDARAAATPAEQIEEQIEEEVVEPVEKIEPKPKPKPRPKPTPARNVIQDDNSEALALRKKKKQEQDRLAKEQAEEAAIEEALAAKEAAVERKKREALEAKRKALAEAKAKREAEAQALKNQIGDIFSNSNGSGSGSGGSQGNQGQPDGDPDGSALDGISTGAGDIGGGLGNRGVLFAPNITNSTQKTGKVVVDICVNSAGKVISADYTQRGSTTNDLTLRRIAEKSAREYKFTKGDRDKQCGTVTIVFKLR